MRRSYRSRDALHCTVKEAKLSLLQETHWYVLCIRSDAQLIHALLSRLMTFPMIFVRFPFFLRFNIEVAYVQLDNVIPILSVQPSVCIALKR